MHFLSTIHLLYIHKFELHGNESGRRPPVQTDDWILFINVFSIGEVMQRIIMTV